MSEATSLDVSNPFNSLNFRDSRIAVRIWAAFFLRENEIDHVVNFAPAAHRSSIANVNSDLLRQLDGGNGEVFRSMTHDELLARLFIRGGRAVRVQHGRLGYAQFVLTAQAL